MYYKNLDEEKVVSVYFKYYRQNLYFEKAIRYDEIYFSSNEELNDPLDLAFTPYFDDNEVAWEKLLQVKPKVEMLNIALYLDTTSHELASELNSIFKGSTLAYQQTIKSLIDSKNKELKRIFIKHINNAIESEYTSDKNSNFSNFDTEAKAEMCISFLTEILSRGWSKKFYSCSFSKNALEPKMWAHYADGFKGCVIIYESNENSSIKLKPHFSSIEYVPYAFSKVQYTNIEKKLSIVNNGLQLRSVGKSFAISEGKWGCINNKGKEVVKCQYDLIYPFREKITFVQKSGKWGMIDEKGKEVIPCMYDDVCYKSNYQTIDTQFDMAPTTVLKKTIIPYQQYGIVYMFQQNKIYSFSSNGSILSINNLSNH